MNALHAHGHELSRDRHELEAGNSDCCLCRWQCLKLAALGASLLLVFLLGNSCSSRHPQTNPSVAMNDLVSPFFSSEQHPESPKPPNAQWRGVLIAAPAQAALTVRTPIVLLRGTYRIQGANYPKEDRLRLVATEVATRKQFAALAGQHDPSPDVPPPDSETPDPETLKRMIFSGFFNTDLVATLKLPWTNATYRVRAELGTIPSNEITVQIVVK
jgi:hypothetical protein